jgi:excinuclease UvrABC nuclease subunit
MLACQVLKGDTKAFRSTLNEAIMACNAKLNFEEARQLHAYAQDLDMIFNAIAVTYGPGRYRHESAHTISQSSIGAEQPHALYNDAELELQRLLGISHPIITIDCFDISHVQGHFMVGSCIRFTRGIPDRKKFRRFKINTLIAQNDYAALQEIATRRYKNVEDIPDVVLIDGGKGQLSAIKLIMPHAHVIALAKREERLFGTIYPEGVVLNPSSALGKLLIALRDYAHRFALNYHKLLRKKGIHGSKKT